MRKTRGRCRVAVVWERHKAAPNSTYLAAVPRKAAPSAILCARMEKVWLVTDANVESGTSPVGSGLFANLSDQRRPFVGVSRARSWSRLLVLGAILWAFIAKT